MIVYVILLITTEKAVFLVVGVIESLEPLLSGFVSELILCWVYGLRYCWRGSI